MKLKNNFIFSPASAIDSMAWTAAARPCR